MEVIIALVIVGAAIAIALPMLNSTPVYLAADVQDLQNNLQVARGLAVSRTVHYHLLVASASQYLIERSNGAGGWVTERTINLRPNIIFDPTNVVGGGTAAEFTTRGYLQTSATLTFTLHDTAHGPTSARWTKQVTVNAVGMVDKQ